MSGFTTGRGYLDDVSLVSAKLGPGTPAVWVEKCRCPAGYDGLFCERCATGYRRRFPGQGPRSPCDPCSCQGGTCDPETGLLFQWLMKLNTISMVCVSVMKKKKPELRKVDLLCLQEAVTRLMRYQICRCALKVIMSTANSPTPARSVLVPRVRLVMLFQEPRM